MGPLKMIETKTQLKCWIFETKITEMRQGTSKPRKKCLYHQPFKSANAYLQTHYPSMTGFGRVSVSSTSPNTFCFNRSEFKTLHIYSSLSKDHSVKKLSTKSYKYTFSKRLDPGSLKNRGIDHDVKYLTGKVKYMHMKKRSAAEINDPVVDESRKASCLFDDIDGLYNWLCERLPEKTLDTWGTESGTKSLKNLWVELIDGESSLQNSHPPKRIVNVACIRIINERGQELIEAHQEMENGHFRSRNRPLSEKIKCGESVKMAALRGIREELGSLGESQNVTLFADTYATEKLERISGSFPGLPTKYVFHKVTAKVVGLPFENFCTEENESSHRSNNEADGLDELRTIGVKRHFWIWKYV